MADSKLPRSINTEESADMSSVTVKLEIPGLKVEKKLFGAAKPKSRDCEVNVKFELSGLEVSAKTTSGGTVTNYCYKVNQLPGEIDPDNCKTEYKKDMIILTLAKKDESTWAVLLSKNGLDQAPTQ